VKRKTNNPNISIAIKDDASKFDRTKDVDEDPGTSTLFNTIIKSLI